MDTETEWDITYKHNIWFGLRRTDRHAVHVGNVNGAALRTASAPAQSSSPFTAQPGGGVVEFFLFKSSLNLLLQLHLACQTLKITIKTTQWRLGPIKSVLAFFSSA